MFEEREKIMEFYERVSGARMHTTFFRFGGIYGDIHLNLLSDIKKFAENFLFRLDDIEILLVNSRL
jgi:NADH-quinone oxidoreductase subunit D